MRRRVEKLTIRRVLEIRCVFLFPFRNQVLVWVRESAPNTLCKAQPDLLVEGTIDKSHPRVNQRQLQVINPNAWSADLYCVLYVHMPYHSLHFQVNPKLLK